MAGEWLKFDKATPDKPEVFAIASELGIDPDAVVGKLMRVWSWFDTHTESGNARSVTPALLDRIAGVSGFATAMANAGWLLLEKDGCSLPNFDRHCGKTAKTRAQNNKRVSDLRARNAASVTKSAPEHVPEKRREENKELRAIGQQAARFEAFWAAYPEKKGKADALRAWKRRGLDAIADRIIADVAERLAKDRQWLDGYIPHGSTYVNASGWEDAITPPRNGRGNAQVEPQLLPALEA